MPDFAHMNRISKCAAIRSVFENLMNLSPFKTVSSIDLAINNPRFGILYFYKDTPAEWMSACQKIRGTSPQRMYDQILFSLSKFPPFQSPSTIHVPTWIAKNCKRLLLFHHFSYRSLHATQRYRHVAINWEMAKALTIWQMMSTPRSPKYDPACDQCRKKKTRCGREHPSCNNCQRTGLICDFSERGKRPSQGRLMFVKLALNLIFFCQKLPGQALPMPILCCAHASQKLCPVLMLTRVLPNLVSEA